MRSGPNSFHSTGYNQVINQYQVMGEILLLSTCNLLIKVFFVIKNLLQNMFVVTMIIVIVLYHVYIYIYLLHDRGR